MASIFGIPDFPAGDPTDAARLASPHAAGLFVCYPGPATWLALYDPRGSRDKKASYESYKSLRHHHLSSVPRILDTLCRSKSGQAVLAEIGASSHETLIYPFDFRPSMSWSVEAAKTLAESNAYAFGDVDAMLATYKAGLKLCLHDDQGAEVCHVSRGGGSTTAIFFESLRANGKKGPEETLLHELVHAARQTRGLFQVAPMSGGFVNREEFLALVVENIYRSEHNLAPVPYRGPPFADVKAFLALQVQPPPRKAIETLRAEQRLLFDALADIPVAFNPLRVVRQEGRR